MSVTPELARTGGCGSRSARAPQVRGHSTSCWGNIRTGKGSPLGALSLPHGAGGPTPRLETWLLIQIQSLFLFLRARHPVSPPYNVLPHSREQPGLKSGPALTDATCDSKQTTSVHPVSIQTFHEKGLAGCAFPNE